MIHLRNGRADRHAHTRGDGKTWCGKKLLGSPTKSQSGNDVFSSYGNEIEVTLDPDGGDCERCKVAFDAAYATAFPDGPKPVATFRLDSPEDLECARKFLEDLR